MCCIENVSTCIRTMCVVCVCVDLISFHLTRRCLSTQSGWCGWSYSNPFPKTGWIGRSFKYSIKINGDLDQQKLFASFPNLSTYIDRSILYSYLYIHVYYITYMDKTNSYRRSGIVMLVNWHHNGGKTWGILSWPDGMRGISYSY